MIRTMLSCFTAASVVALVAAAPVNAQQFGKRSGASTGYSKSFGANNRYRSRPMQQRRVRRFRRDDDQLPLPASAASIYALGVYLQWRECLDNMLPECP